MILPDDAITLGAYLAMYPIYDIMGMLKQIMNTFHNIHEALQKSYRIAVGKCKDDGHKGESIPCKKDQAHPPGISMCYGFIQLHFATQIQLMYGLPCQYGSSQSYMICGPIGMCKRGTDRSACAAGKLARQRKAFL